MKEKPKNPEMDKLEKQFDEFDKQVKELTQDRMNEAPLKEVEQQTKISGREIDKSKDIYLKPHRTISSKEKFNENFRNEYNFAKEYVHFIAENYEIIGETIDMWTKPFPGLPAEWWQIPTNKPVWAPRYVAEQISRCKYHRLQTVDKPVSQESGMTYYGTMVADTTINRLDAKPVLKQRSIFMGATSF